MTYDVQIIPQESLAVADEVIGTGNASDTTFAITLANAPVVPGSVGVDDGTEAFTDDASGILTGDAGGAGTIDYSTGDISVTVNTATGNSIDVEADYNYTADNDIHTNSVEPSVLSVRNEDSVEGQVLIRYSDDQENWSIQKSFLIEPRGIIQVGVVGGKILDVRLTGARCRLFGLPAQIQ